MGNSIMKYINHILKIAINSKQCTKTTNDYLVVFCKIENYYKRIFINCYIEDTSVNAQLLYEALQMDEDIMDTKLATFKS